MASSTDPRPPSALSFAGLADSDIVQAQEAAWIEVIRKMEEVYSDFAAFLDVSSRLQMPPSTPQIS
jgi:two-component system sensor histidine kinase HupT/HoxJ